jgi:hypothetical protein
VRTFALALIALASCARDNQLADGGSGLDFDVAGTHLHIASGTARVENGALALYLTDQPDACLAVKQVPVGASTTLAVRVAARTDGTTSADVVSGPAAPGPGQALATLTSQVGGSPTGSHTGSDGSVVWAANSDGTTTITRLELGFQGTTDRISVGPLTVPACQ